MGPPRRAGRPSGRRRPVLFFVFIFFTPSTPGRGPSHCMHVCVIYVHMYIHIKCVQMCVRYVCVCVCARGVVWCGVCEDDDIAELLWLAHDTKKQTNKWGGGAS